MSGSNRRTIFERVSYGMNERPRVWQDFSSAEAGKIRYCRCAMPWKPHGAAGLQFRRSMENPVLPLRHAVEAAWSGRTSIPQKHGKSGIATAPCRGSRMVQPDCSCWFGKDYSKLTARVVGVPRYGAPAIDAEPGAPDRRCKRKWRRAAADMVCRSTPCRAA